MPTAELPFPTRFDRPPVPVRRFSVDEYHQMGESGLLTPDDRVELLEGWIAPKMNQNPAHSLAIEKGQELLQSILPAGWRLRTQLPITTHDSEPEPDLAIVRRQRGKQTHPMPTDVALVIEVADSSLGIDRRVKGRLYARSSIPVYWIVNLIDRRVEVFTDPSGATAAPAYLKRQFFGARGALPLIVAGKEVAMLSVKDLLP